MVGYSNALRTNIQHEVNKVVYLNGYEENGKYEDDSETTPVGNFAYIPQVDTSLYNYVIMYVDGDNKNPLLAVFDIKSNEIIYVIADGYYVPTELGSNGRTTWNERSGNIVIPDGYYSYDNGHRYYYGNIRVKIVNNRLYYYSDGYNVCLRTCTHHIFV